MRYVNKHTYKMNDSRVDCCKRRTDTYTRNIDNIDLKTEY